MPMAPAKHANLYYEDVGEGNAIIFVHEFGADHREWQMQVRHFTREFRCIRYNARGYPPSDVPSSPEHYGYLHSADDVIAVMDAAGVDKAHVVGLSMGGYAALQVGLRYPDRAHSIVVAAAGSGAIKSQHAEFARSSNARADMFLAEGSEAVSHEVGNSTTRIQLKIKDPLGWQEFMDHLAEHSPEGSAHTLRQYQAARPSIFDMEAQMNQCTVPTLLVVGDEDDTCIEPNVFMKRSLVNAQLLVVPGTGHAVNLEEPALFNDFVYRFLTRVERGFGQRDPRTRASKAG